MAAFSACTEVTARPSRCRCPPSGQCGGSVVRGRQVLRDDRDRASQAPGAKETPGRTGPEVGRFLPDAFIMLTLIKTDFEQLFILVMVKLVCLF